LRAFTAADVRFLIVGAYALALHGLDRVRCRFGDLEVDFIGRASFLRNKRATGRHKDLGDIEGMD